jgi:broad specificity phosphatase PhoE
VTSGLTRTGQLGEPTRLLLLRHGETELSAQRRYSGRSDPPLTERGRAQAADAARHLAGRRGIAAVVTSPLRRARRTAESIAAELGVPLTVHEGLIETDFGAWDGLTFAEVANRDPELHARWLADPTVTPPCGESFDAVALRVGAAADEVVAAHPAADVVVVSHVTPIKMLLRDALDAGPAFLHRLHLDLASLSVVARYPDGGVSVRLVNGYPNEAARYGTSGW